MKREDLGAISQAVFLDCEAFGIAVLNSEDPGREGDVPQLNVMEEGSQENAEHQSLWDSVWGTESGRFTNAKPAWTLRTIE